MLRNTYICKKIRSYIPSRGNVSIVKNSSLFDSTWYADEYQVASNRAALHYLIRGWKLGHNPSRDFLTQDYLNNYSDVREAMVNPLLHYEKYGKKEGRVFNNILNSDKTQKTFLEYIKESAYFDAEWYERKYQVPRTKAASHYLSTGWQLLYDPSKNFSTAAYLLKNNDVLRAMVNPLLHYEMSGKKEYYRYVTHKAIADKDFYGKCECIRKSIYFDEEWYRKKYHLTKQVDAALHYLVYGVPFSLDPSPFFSTHGYILLNNLGERTNPPVNPILHFELTQDSYNLKVISHSDNMESVLRNFDATDKTKLKTAVINERKVTNSIIAKNRKSDETVDVIICVHNALEDVKLCIESVLKHTTEPYRIIIVNDNSNPETTAFLEACTVDKHIELINHFEGNHGYTYAANIGLHASNAKYNVLLNSDTIVFEHWIDNMIECSKVSNAGIVGPLSNTASWQSIPRLTDDDGDWCHNVLPKGISGAQMAHIVESDSIKLYPQVPLLNGFCLMITRETIEKNGYFDEENFGRGFAEEDDYNSRAVKNGIKLAIADNTYIFHAQSKSYTDAKRIELSSISGKRLREKHGEQYISDCCNFMFYHQMINSFRARTEMNIEKQQVIALGKKKYKAKKILVLLPTRTAGGGANIVLSEFNAMTKMGVKVTIANLCIHKQVFEETYKELLTNFDTLYVNSFDEINSVISNYDAVICTLYSTVYSINQKKKKLPVIGYYVQDYEPYFFDESNPEYKVAVGSYSEIPNIVRFTKTFWNQNELFEQLGLSSHRVGISCELELFRPRKAEINHDKVIITAMLRPSTPRRGPETTVKVLRQIAKEYGDKVEIRFFGCDCENDLSEYVFFRNQEMDFTFLQYGLLSPEETAQLLSETDVFVDFSTFQAMGLTAMEAMASGCATIVPVHGGTKDFAINEVNSLIIDTTSIDECYHATKRLIDDYDLRRRIALQGIKDMCQHYPEKVALNILEALFK